MNTVAPHSIMEEDKERSFTNPFLSSQACNKGPAKGTKESENELGSVVRQRLLSLMTSELKLIDQECTSSNDQSVYTGVTGAALLHLHLSTSLFRDDSQRSKTELVKALELISPCLDRLNTRRSTFLCGAAGPLAIGVVVCGRLEQWDRVRHLIRQLEDLYKDHKKEFENISSELLYGQAGYLYSLLFVNSHIPGAVEEEIISEVSVLLLKIGQNGCQGAHLSPLMYTWHYKQYLGAAHGLAGILTVLMQTSSPSVVSRHKDLVKPCVDYLLSLQLPSGNFPSSIESIGKDRLVHWCHGAPGLCHMFAVAYRIFGESRYLKAAEDCGDVVWRRGLLKKGYGLCHGVAGNGYVFLQLYRLTGHEYHLQRAIKFAEWCLSSSDRHCHLPDHPTSLFEGSAGKLYFLADLCSSATEARYPALELPVVHNPLSLQ